MHFSVLSEKTIGGRMSKPVSLPFGTRISLSRSGLKIGLYKLLWAYCLRKDNFVKFDRCNRSSQFEISLLHED